MASESELAGLNEEQRATVLAWVEDRMRYREIIELMAQPAPEGFGIKTNLGTLSRFITKWKRDELLKNVEEDAQQAVELEKAQEATGMDFAKATMRALHQQLFRSALRSGDVKAQMEMMRLLMEHEARMKRLEIAEKNHALATRRFEFCAAREAMMYWNDFKDIDARTDIDDIDKIWLARDRMFAGPNGEAAPRTAAAGPKGKVENAECKIPAGAGGTPSFAKASEGGEVRGLRTPGGSGDRTEVRGLRAELGGSSNEQRAMSNEVEKTAEVPKGKGENAESKMEMKSPTTEAVAKQGKLLTGDNRENGDAGSNKNGAPKTKAAAAPVVMNPKPGEPGWCPVVPLGSKPLKEGTSEIYIQEGDEITRLDAEI